LVRVPLPVANGPVIVTAVARYVVERLFALHVPRALPYDNGKFTLIIKLARHPRSYHRLPVAHLRVCETGEDDRMARRFSSSLLNMAAVI
jgi:hypothetical protein